MWLFQQFLEKFSDRLIIILLIAGFLSIGISCYGYIGLGESWETFFESVGIFVAIFLATGIAFVFELKADKQFAILTTPIRFKKHSFMSFLNRIGVIKKAY